MTMKTTTVRCPVTGQVGICPSQQAAALDDHTKTSLRLSPQEQQANLWQSLLERNGHVKTLEQAASFVEDDLPEIIADASTASFSISDDDSLSSSLHKPQEERVWPSYDQVSAHVLVADYHESLTSGADQHAVGENTKLLCPHGVVCQARLEFFEAPAGCETYTGLLSPGSTVDHCLVRLSSALRPVDHGGGAWAKAVARRTFGAKLAASQILPAAAIKCLRGGGRASGNLLLMGSKVGQAHRNFFQHALCTAVTEKIPALGLPFLRRFSRYSKYPLSLGLSELGQYDAQGEETAQPNFPFALCLQPVAQMESSSSEQGPFDAFVEDIPREIAPGTHLFDIYAAPTPESVGNSHELQRIGRVVSTSGFVYSSPTDGLTFRHQVKEDDLQLREDWEDRMHSTQIQAPDGTQGTSAKLTGWQIFEDHIQGAGDYVDFEQKNKASLGRKTVSFADQPPLQVPGWTFCGFQKARVEVSAS